MQPRWISPVQCFFELDAYQEEGRASLRDGLGYFAQIFHSRHCHWRMYPLVRTSTVGHLSRFSVVSITAIRWMFWLKPPMTARGGYRSSSGSADHDGLVDLAHSDEQGADVCRAIW